MAENLFEALKTRLFKDKEPQTYTDYEDDKVTIDKSIKVGHETINPPVGFFDDQDEKNSGWFSNSAKSGALVQQADLIAEYRRVAQSPEGRLAIDEIVNEAIFVPGSDDTLKIDVDSGKLTEKTCEVIIETFNELSDIMDIEMNIGYLFEKWYTDGQLVLQVIYDNNDLSKGITGFNVLDPAFLTYNKKDNEWTYAKQVTNSYTQRKEIKYDGQRKYSSEEIIFISSELFEKALSDINGDGIKIIKSHLHNAIKVFNQLTSLEDMLIPMRFSRSVSRRVFNVDVGDLPASKAEAALNRIKDKFKYKKFYDVDKGTISNQMHIASLVEDYWFQNRDGSKGTQVDTLDESGNLGELGDITYFRKKLFGALKIPMSRVLDEVEGQQSEFDYGASAVSREEIKFFAFIQKLRRQFLRIFREAMKRHMLYKGIIADENEWNNIRKHIKISFTKENIFLETMDVELLTQKIGLYGDIEEMIGKEFSKEWVRKKVLKLSDEEIKEMKDQIAKEKAEGEYETSEDSNSRW